ncbi:MAG: GSCFA domain-containing protein [Candidatus Amulumruptor sp.]|nr:GSCFA domain-containing protein [Candidatus Amulumruptor sp.]
MQLKLRTEIRVNPRPGLLTHDRPIILLGSCFSDNIGSRLAQRGFTVCYNPLGPVYNAAAMAAQAHLIASCATVEPDSLFEHQGLWRHWLAHTLLARANRAEAAAAINRELDRVRALLADPVAPLLCLTLGTAWAFTLNDGSGLTVSNCHKVPAARFNRRLMPLAEVTDSLRDTIATLGRPGSHTIVTVSPIRHLADGLDGNSLSKATLRLSADSVTSADVTYFPAFEALVDDLRDYRFYTPDMTHPTEQAADYVYAIFEEAYATADTRATASRALAEHRRLAHRPLI